MKKQLTYTKFLMETIILTGAVAIIAAAVYFFNIGHQPHQDDLSVLGDGDGIELLVRQSFPKRPDGVNYRNGGRGEALLIVRKA